MDQKVEESVVGGRDGTPELGLDLSTRISVNEVAGEG